MSSKSAAMAKAPILVIIPFLGQSIHPRTANRTRPRRLASRAFPDPCQPSLADPTEDNVMLTSFDGLLAARLLLTVVTIGYGFITILADFNKTHATNPAWTPHARFHVVWQITSYAGFALIALALIWVPGPFERERLFLACGFAGVVFAAFFIALLAMPLYGGRTFDD